MCTIIDVDFCIIFRLKSAREILIFLQCFNALHYLFFDGYVLLSLEIINFGI